MKFIRSLFFVLLALCLIAGTGIFIFFETFDADKYLPQITREASRVLGRPVSIEHIGLGLSSMGLTLDAGPLTIADDTAFTTQPFIKIDRVRVSPDLRSLIFRRKINISGILLQSPEIHIIRSEEGNFNFRSIGHASPPAGDNTAGKMPKGGGVSSSSAIVPPAGEAGSEVKQSLNIKDMTVKSVRIQDASISFIDQNETTPLDIWLLNINASLKDFSLSDPFQLSFDASPFMLKAIAPGVQDSPVLKNIAGKVQLNMAHMKVNASGGLDANGDITATEGVIKDFNIIKVLLPHTLGAFGGLDSAVDKLGADDTIIEKAGITFSLHDKIINIEDFMVQTNILELKAQGSVDQGFNMDMQTMLHLNADASAAVVNELEGAKYLMDDSQRIAIGASLKGVIPHLKYKLDKDFRKKSKKALMEEGGNILKGFL